MTDQAIRVRGLRKQYQDVCAVDGVDLEIAPGQIFALLGPNGAGKTTTVEILEGHRPRTAGEVEVLGVDPHRASRQWRSQIGIVLQDTTDSGELRVQEVLAHYARCYSQPRRPAEVLELVGLAEQTKRRVSLLSGGQRRRLDVAIGIIGRPKVLFLDEPTTGFDPQARRQFWELIGTLATDGTTIVLTTHYMDEAEALADRVAIIVRGRVVAEGPPATLGGRTGALTTVSWLDGAELQQVTTGKPAAVVTELASRYGDDVPGLTVTRPTLEDIYLDLIGQSS